MIEYNSDEEWSATVSTHFTSGQVNGYFGSKPTGRFMFPQT